MEIFKIIIAHLFVGSILTFLGNLILPVFVSFGVFGELPIKLELVSSE